MTDDPSFDPLVRELEEIERKTPAIPLTFATLRALLASLPNPQLPDVQSARQGTATPNETQALGAGGVSSALTGLPPGFESGAGIGMFPALYFGLANLLVDPTFESVRASTRAGLVTIGTSETVVGNIASLDTWFAQQIGATSAVCKLIGVHSRLSPDTTPYNSSSVLLHIDASASGTHELRVRSQVWDGAAAAGYPYLVGAVRVTTDVTNSGTSITSRSLVVEVYDSTSAVVRASQTIDIGSIAAFDQSRMVVASLPYAGQAWDGHQFQLRVRLIVVATGNAAAQEYLIGEPQLVQSQTASPPPFAPIAAGWTPDRVRQFGHADFSGASGSPVVQAGVAGDTDGRVEIYGSGELVFGPGSADPDTALKWIAAGIVRLYGIAGATGTLELLEDTDPGFSASVPNRVRFYAGTDKHLHSHNRDDEDLSLSGGRQMIGGYENLNVAAGAAAGAMPLLGGVTTAYSSRPIAPLSGKILGIAWRRNGTITAGAITLKPTIGGAGQGSGVVINSVSATSGFTALGPYAVGSGASVGIDIESTADLAPATIDIGAWLAIEWYG